MKFKYKQWQMDMMRRLFPGWSNLEDSQFDALLAEFATQAETEFKELPEAVAEQKWRERVFSTLITSIAHGNLGNKDDLQFLIEKSKDEKVDLQDIGAFAMLQAALVGNWEPVDMLLDNGFDFNAVVLEGFYLGTTTSDLIISEASDKLQDELKAKIGFDETSELRKIIRENGKIEQVKDSIEQLKSMRESMGEARYTNALTSALMIAVLKDDKNMNMEVVKSLIIAGADVNKAMSTKYELKFKRILQEILMYKEDLRPLPKDEKTKENLLEERKTRENSFVNFWIEPAKSLAI